MKKSRKEAAAKQGKAKKTKKIEKKLKNIGSRLIMKSGKKLDVGNLYSESILAELGVDNLKMRSGEIGKSNKRKVLEMQKAGKKKNKSYTGDEAQKTGSVSEEENNTEEKMKSRKKKALKRRNENNTELVDLGAQRDASDNTEEKMKSKKKKASEMGKKKNTERVHTEDGVQRDEEEGKVRSGQKKKPVKRKALEMQKSTKKKNSEAGGDLLADEEEHRGLENIHEKLCSKRKKKALKNKNRNEVVETQSNQNEVHQNGANEEEKIEAEEKLPIGNIEGHEVHEKGNGKQEKLRGLKKWLAEYNAKRPGIAVLQQQIDSYIADYEEREEQARKEKEEAAANDGWTVVTHQKGRKKTTDVASGVAVGGVSAAAVAANAAKRKTQTAADFYKFQKREARRNEVLELRLKFQEDKKRIAQMRAARKFRPY